jgi:hypothetical protein
MGCDKEYKLEHGLAPFIELFGDFLQLALGLVL